MHFRLFVTALGNLPPGKLPPIKLFSGKSSRKFSPSIFSSGIFHRILKTRSIIKGSVSHLPIPFVRKWGKGEVYTFFTPWIKIFNVCKTTASFLVKLCIIKKTSQIYFANYKYKILLIIYWPSFGHKKISPFLFFNFLKWYEAIT